MGGIYPPPVLPTNKITLQTTSAMHAVAAIVEVPGSSESRKSSYAPEVKSHTVYSTNSENKRLCLNLHSCLVQTHNTETNCGISAYRKEIQLQEIHFVSDSFPKLGYWGHVRQRNIVSKLGGKHSIIVPSWVYHNLSPLYWLCTNIIKPDRHVVWYSIPLSGVF